MIHAEQKTPVLSADEAERLTDTALAGSTGSATAMDQRQKRAERQLELSSLIAEATGTAPVARSFSAANTSVRVRSPKATKSKGRDIAPKALPGAVAGTSRRRLRTALPISDKLPTATFDANFDVGS